MNNQICIIKCMFNTTEQASLDNQMYVKLSGCTKSECLLNFCSFEGIMSCMMIQPHNQPKNAHFIGHLGHTLNNPINIQVKMLMKKMRWRWS
jgi:hypothetical protein